ncbi:hypothetical protein RRG08_009921 [Elysia crispata]|uniref:Uncharacterized protein n=1 Tax=Elysia crispata TaxID=231223 RepID=A0AAE1AR96_9GAST|nr:hypothetical protein RRG08_009921 [Elysia crispata]
MFYPLSFNLFHACTSTSQSSRLTVRGEQIVILLLGADRGASMRPSMGILISLSVIFRPFLPVRSCVPCLLRAVRHNLIRSAEPLDLSRLSILKTHPRHVRALARPSDEAVPSLCQACTEPVLSCWRC